MKDEVLSSPIRWAGSKKRVLNDMLESFKRDKENYKQNNNKNFYKNFFQLNHQPFCNFLNSTKLK